MRNLNDLFASLLFFFVGIGVIIRAFGLGVGKPTEPQPGSFPFLGGGLLVFLSGILLFRTLRRRGGEAPVFGKIGPPFLLILGLMAYLVIFKVAGYIIATIVLSGISLRVLKMKSWWRLAVVSPLIAIGTYFLFDRILDVPLPKGILSGLF